MATPTFKQKYWRLPATVTFLDCAILPPVKSSIDFYFVMSKIKYEKTVNKIIGDVHGYGI